MPLVRSLIIAIFVSVGLWLLGMALGIYTADTAAGMSAAADTGGQGTYAVLACSDTIPDREIRQRLENQGFSGLVSESGQRVLLDSFGGMEHIPLDEYNSRVLPFDPRNDGYAEKLRSLFVQDGTRFIYIPVNSLVPVKLAGVEKRIAAALGDIDYSYTRQLNTPLNLAILFILFCCAAASFFIIAPLRRALRPYAACLIPCLPVLAPLALCGAAGFALASLLAGFAVLLAGFAFERFTHPHILSRQLPRLLSPLLLLCYGLISFFSGLPLVFPLVVFAFFCGMLVFSVKGASQTDNAAAAWDDLLFKRRKPEHRRFSPVTILKRRVSVFAFSWAMLPFAAAAALVPAFAGMAGQGGAPAVPLSVASLTEADYHAHYLFQSAFSHRPLHAAETEDRHIAHGMGAYEWDTDGLLAPAGDAETPEIVLAGIPPFPLADLLRYLNNAPSGTAAGTATGTTAAYGSLFALLPLLFILPALLRRWKNTDIYPEKILHKGTKSRSH